MQREVRRGSLVFEGLTKRYGSVTVVQMISAAIAAGEFFSLLGPSGSGKTTTLMMIAGFVEPDAGSINLAGEDLTRVPAQKRGLGMVFQNYALFPHLNVYNNIAFPLHVRRVRDPELAARVREALALVRLESFEQRPIRELSGGQQQRVALARAIVHRPRVVLMDEPLGALDKNLRYEMQTEIKEIQRRLGMTVVYITHDQEEAMHMSDRIAIMNRGRIVQVGPPSEVYELPHTSFVGRFLGEANLIAGSADGAAFKTVGGAVLTAARPATAGCSYLFVRPEKIRLAEAESRRNISEAGCNTLKGHIARVSFLGSIIRYAVAAGEPELVSVDAANTDCGRIVAEGTPVFLTWRTADSRILERQDEMA
jgi:spermidine/putrescine ABC transporter ATP-binding subunit